jgi:hypothetical protein
LCGESESGLLLETIDKAPQVRRGRRTFDEQMCVIGHQTVRKNCEALIAGSLH